MKIWQAHADSRPSNPFLYLARLTEFIVRRCFFPYALLFFALFNIMNVAFVLSAIGANLVWPVALYSSQAFARGKGLAGLSSGPAEAGTGMRGYYQLSLRGSSTPRLSLENAFRRTQYDVASPGRFGF